MTSRYKFRYISTMIVTGACFALAITLIFGIPLDITKLKIVTGIGFLIMGITNITLKWGIDDND